MSRRQRATPTRVAGLALVCLLAAGCTAGPDTSPTSPSPAPPAASTAPQSEEPASAPVLGGFHVLVPDPAGEGVLLLNGPPDGGHDDGPMVLWRWDGSAWDSVPVDGEAPDARSFFAAAYDDRRDVVVVHGGETVAGASGETWEWDGRQWHGFGDDGPGARGASAMVFDPATGQSVLYGGSAASGEITNDTWSWDGRRWSRLATDGPVPPRWPAAAVADAETESLLLYGGHQVDDRWPGALADTWVWEGSGWVEAAPSGPGPRVNAHALVHPELGVLLVGGSSMARESGDVWRWDGTGWDRIGEDVFPRRQAFGLAYDAGRRVVVMSGGVVEPGSAQRHQDVWEWSGDPGVPAERVAFGPPA